MPPKNSIAVGAASAAHAAGSVTMPSKFSISLLSATPSENQAEKQHADDKTDTH